MAWALLSERGGSPELSPQDVRVPVFGVGSCEESTRTAVSPRSRLRGPQAADPGRAAAPLPGALVVLVSLRVSSENSFTETSRMMVDRLRPHQHIKAPISLSGVSCRPLSASASGLLV